MVRIKDDFIEYIDVDDLKNLKEEDSLEIGVHRNCYYIGKKDIISLTDDSIKFLERNDVVDLDYEDITYLYKIKRGFDRKNFNLEDYLMILLFVVIAIILVVIFLIRGLGLS